MSKSYNEKKMTISALNTDEHKKVLSRYSLFSEIMKNHSGQNTPISSEPMPFNVREVPLPVDVPPRHHIKKQSRKRTHDENVAANLRKEPLASFPKICERRTHIRHNSTWGERSVKVFKILTEVGEGTYGHVFKAVDRVTNTVIALKKVRLENEREGFPITTVREIKILQQLNHQNIVRLHEVVTDYDLDDAVQRDKHASNKGFYLVFEYMDHDLYGVLDSGISLTELQIASIIKQILEGINYTHKKMFLHRDIKCSNILINNRGEVKIADYGLSRRFNSDETKRPYTNKVITLWYRAPELLLGEEYYGTSIDMWSIGCIMGELFTHRTMFMANSEMEQMDAISKICGTPSPATWPEVNKLPLYQSYKPKFPNKRRLREYYFTVPKNALDVLDWLLILDPKRRCSADQALRSYWLEKIDSRKIEPPRFPTDGDYHELSCKRRHKLNRSDTGYKSYKSSLKAQKSSGSNISDEVSVGHSESNRSGDTKHNHSSSNVIPYQLPNDMLTMLNEQLRSIIPDTGTIERLLQDHNFSQDTNIKDALEQLLEPYIRQMLTSQQIPSIPNISNPQSTDNRPNSDRATSRSKSHNNNSIRPNNLSEKQL